MSKAKLKKALAALEKEELVTMVMELYAARKEAKEYLEFWIDPDTKKELERVEKLVDRQFFTPQGVSRRSVSAPTVNRLIKDFMTICFEPERVAELLIFTAERMGDWMTERYRSVSYRTALRKYTDEAALYVESHELEEIYGIRIERLRERTDALERLQESMTPTRGRRRHWW